MAVYVDAMVKVNGVYWCHMATDDPTLNELHNMAERIHLNPDWFQTSSLLPHFDLQHSKREAAIKAGAIVVSSTDLLRKCASTFTRPSPALRGNR